MNLKGAFCTLLLVSAALAEVTPIDAPLKEGGITEITVHYDGTEVKGGKITFKPPPGEYHYYLFIPPDYNKDPKELFPLLFIQSPGGNSGLGPQKKLATEHRYVVAMLQEARNGPWDPIIANFCAAHDDVVKRCRIAEGFKYMTGFSGGARSSTFCSELRPGFAGAFCQGAALWPYYADQPHNNNIGIFIAMGCTDSNAKEMPQTHKLIAADRGFYPIFFDGGHTNASPEIVDQAFEWLEWWSYYGNATQKEARPMYLQQFAKLQAQAAAASGDFEKWELLDKAEKLVTVRQLSKEKEVPAQLTALRKSLGELARKDAVKKEIAAKVAFQKIADGEYLARRQAKGDLAAHKQLMAQASAAYGDVAKKHPGTVYGEKATAAAARTLAESKLEGKAAK